MDFVNGKVGISGETELLGCDVHNDKNWVWGESLDDLVNGEIRGPELRASVVPPNNLLLCCKKRAPTDGVRLGRGQGGGEERWQLTVDLPEESPHVLEVVVVQEPDGGILVILFKGN